MAKRCVNKRRIQHLSGGMHRIYQKFEIHVHFYA